MYVPVPTIGKRDGGRFRRASAAGLFHCAYLALRGLDVSCCVKLLQVARHSAVSSSGSSSSSQRSRRLCIATSSRVSLATALVDSRQRSQLNVPQRAQAKSRTKRAKSRLSLAERSERLEVPASRSDLLREPEPAHGLAGATIPAAWHKVRGRR
jgi:hypothetical protein